MLNRPEPACLVIADISGYTSYIAGTELEHSQDILADLISTVVGALRPLFRLAKLEGDAAFVYAPGETIDGSTLQDAIEGCYFAFRRRLRDIRQASTCECNACLLIPNLDLKFVGHHGLVAHQRILGRDELAGADVIVAHRLLKNTIVEGLGVPAYAFYSGDLVAAMGLADPAAAGLVAHAEQIDLGEVRGWVRDLEAAWQAESRRVRVFVEPTDAVWSIETILPGPPAIVWDWITSPARRPKWQQGVDIVHEAAPTGRRGPGTTNHCMHGKRASIEEIVDWRPYEYFTLRFQVPVPGGPKLTMTDTFEAIDQGTRHISRIERPRRLKDRAMVGMITPLFGGQIRADIRALIPLIAEDAARRRAAGSEAGEPEPPVSAERFLREPVRSADATGADVESAVSESLPH
ncbi:MAG: hypothetical protein HW391_5 [Chloroflexi bacterium]|nr:hypothetical protein [Chloroflexota bacterium]